MLFNFVFSVTAAIVIAPPTGVTWMQYQYAALAEWHWQGKITRR